MENCVQNMLFKKRKFVFNKNILQKKIGHDRHEGLQSLRMG